MGLFDKLFGGKKKKISAVKETGEGDLSTALDGSFPQLHQGPLLRPAENGMAITLPLLRQLFPVRNLGEDELRAFAASHKAECYPAGTCLFSVGDRLDAALYLLQGAIRFDFGEGKAIDVTDQSTRARFPLCGTALAGYAAHALTDIQVLRIPRHLQEKQLNAAGPDNMVMLDAASPDLPDELFASPLFADFCDYYQSGRLEVPPLPQVPIKLQKAMSQDGVSIADIAHIVQLDPVIATKLIQVANSPLHCQLGGSPISSCHEAVTRLGLKATHSLVNALAMRGLFRGKQPLVNKLLAQCWRKSLYTAYIAYFLAQENRGVNPDEALLAGLSTEIGCVPFLYFVEKNPNIPTSEVEIEAALPIVRGPVGNRVLLQWNFSSQLAQIPLLAEQWWYECPGENLTLTDLIILARLHTYLGTPRQAELPLIPSLPAYQKLKDKSLGPEHSLEVLSNARDKIQEAIRLFGG